MFKKFNLKKQMGVLVVLILIAFLIALFYFIFFDKWNNKIPAKGSFVENIYKTEILV